jgi:hypothetical protein
MKTYNDYVHLILGVPESLPGSWQNVMQKLRLLRM